MKAIENRLNLIKMDEGIVMTDELFAENAPEM